MANTRTSKRRRPTQSSTSIQGYDLNVPLPEQSSSSKGSSTANIRKKALVERLCHLGYDTVAFSRTVYGQLRTDKDVASTAIIFPEIIPDSCTLLRRVNVVVEELSDIGLYTGAKNTNTVESVSAIPYTGDRTNNKRSLLDGYDIVALSPRNESTFSAACNSARVVDFIMLDYNSSRGRLPYRLRSSDIRAATQLGIAFEICYGPAIVDPAKRKFFVQAAGEFISASASVRPRPTLVLSSGNRTTSNGVDIGTLALRSAVDLINVMKCVLGFDNRTSHAAMRQSAKGVVHHGQTRSSKQGSASALVFSLKNDTRLSLPRLPRVFKAACFETDFPSLFLEADGVIDTSVAGQPETQEQEDHSDGFIILN